MTHGAHSEFEHSKWKLWLGLAFVAAILIGAIWQQSLLFAGLALVLSWIWLMIVHS